MDKRFLTILAAIAVVLVGFFIISTRSSDNKSNASSSTTPPTNHVEGKGSKNVTLIEYGDYECPACESYYPVVKQLASKYNNDIVFQFRNFPLDSIHPNARAGARAAEAAAVQGKFWEMHDALYDHQKDWSTSSNPKPYFDIYANQLGLNMTKFHQDYASDQVNKSINADIAAGQKIKVDQTPTFVLNGTKITNPPTYSEFTKIIDDAIAKATPAKN